MERFSAAARENNLLGHSGRRSFGGSPKAKANLITPTRNSEDLDFKDVFGGPPRRSSLHEWRNSLANNSSGGISVGGDEEEDETISSSRNPWSGLSEKPVFGEETTNNFNRRSNPPPSHEFFDDIFRGDDDYSTSTPIRGEPFFSTPSSRVLSPKPRPLPPPSEPSFVASSLPIPLSLPTKLAKGIDQAFASPSHTSFNKKQTASSGLGFPASPIASKVSTQVVQGRDDLRNDTRPFWGNSASSRGFHLNNEESSRAIKTYKDAEDYSEKSSTSSETNNSTKVLQFHFSIYKWVSKGVPSTMTPLRRRNSFSSKRRVNTETIESEFSGPVSQVVEHHSVSDDKSAEEKSWEYENQDKSSGLKPTKKDTIGSSTFFVEVASAKPESEPVASFISHKAGKGLKPDSVAPGAPKVTAKQVPVLMEQSCTVELKPLYSAFKDESDIQGNDKMVKQPGVKQGTVERINALVGNVDNVKKVKKPTGKRNLLNLSEETSSSLLDSSTSLEDKPIRNKVKGKVKDFVTIFNQDSPSKPTNVKYSQSTGVKGASACQVEDEVNVLPTKGDVKEKVSNLKNKGTLTETLVMDGEIFQKLEKTVKPDIGIYKTTPRKIYTVDETIDASTSFSESIPNIPEAEAGKVEESHYEDLQGDCLVEELSPEQNKLSQTGQNLEEIQACDAKVLKWSNGKQGNIRSLLSTLQYVLWSESGWKPMPLVDIIEGNSVKRAYQKALLCLHPDKLQQKGAAPHQKYIAEKVFDILQAPPFRKWLWKITTPFLNTSHIQLLQCTYPAKSNKY